MTPIDTTPSGIATTYALALQEKFSVQGGERVVVLPGRTFDRIAIANHDSTRTLLGYIKRSTGELIAPDGWVKPLVTDEGLAVRFKLTTQGGFKGAVESADTEGTFLIEH